MVAVAVAGVDAVMGTSGLKTPTIDVRAWQSPSRNLDGFVWPEASSENLANRSDVGVCFSGGGSRAFVAALGEVRALEDLGYMSRTKYMTSVSGGSWFAVLYHYYQTNASNDAELLCADNEQNPEEITMESLANVGAEGCALRAPMESFYGKVAEKFAKSHISPFYDMSRVWADAVGEVFFEPWGIVDSSSFSWNATTVSDIRSRNPGLTQDFILPHSADRPFPIFISTLVGPGAVDEDTSWLGTLAPCNRSFTQVRGGPP